MFAFYARKQHFGSLIHCQKGIDKNPNPKDNQNGVEGGRPKVISEALGHTSVAFTMDVYSHIIDGMQEEAMALLDEVLPSGISKRINANLLASV